MQYREIEIINKLGLHARASARLTKRRASSKAAGLPGAVKMPREFIGGWR